MPRVIIYPYKIGSRSAKSLQRTIRNQGLRCIRVRENSQTFNARRSDLIINWGMRNRPAWTGWPDANLLNDFNAIIIAQDKRTSLEIMRHEGVQTPEFTHEPDIARRWLWDNNEIVLGRALLRGSGGRGIELFNGKQDYDLFISRPRFPLYVKYIKKQHEYRIHVFKDEVIDIQHKRKRRETEDVNYQIRNHENGWIFARNEIVAPEAQVLQEAVKATQALRLDFGAVDIIWNQRQQRAYVLEVNTAPGLEGQTVDKYTEAILGLL